MTDDPIDLSAHRAAKAINLTTPPRDPSLADVFWHMASFAESLKATLEYARTLEYRIAVLERERR